jgi:hypothetical protein
MSSLDTFVKFDVSSVNFFQFMTAGMVENDARPFLDRVRVYPQLCTFRMLVGGVRH